MKSRAKSLIDSRPITFGSLTLGFLVVSVGAVVIVRKPAHSGFQTTASPSPQARPAAPPGSGQMSAGPPISALGAPAADAHITAGLQSYVVQSAPFASALSVAGTVVAGDSDPVTAPFDGVVRHFEAEYGAQVSVGQAILVMDTAEIIQKERAAELEYLKSKKADDDMATWKAGPEVERQRHIVAAANIEYESTLRKVSEAGALFQNGLISKSEYDGLLREEKTSSIQLSAAQDDMVAMLKKGEGINRNITDSELKISKSKLDDLRQSKNKDVVKANSSGILLVPTARAGQSGDAAVQNGEQLTRGQLIGLIAKSNSLNVTFKVNEEDISKIHAGQSVTVTGPGFSGRVLTGRISSIGGQASSSANSGGLDAGPMFIATARLDATGPDGTAGIRIGMSAAVTVNLYQSRAALVVPIQALGGTPSDPTVEIRDPRNAKVQRVRVVVGKVAPDGVEILSGLRAGDIVVWNSPENNRPL
jgi:multidrug resistance efflux pump